MDRHNHNNRNPGGFDSDWSSFDDMFDEFFNDSFFGSFPFAGRFFNMPPDDKMMGPPSGQSGPPAFGGFPGRGNYNQPHRPGCFRDQMFKKPEERLPSSFDHSTPNSGVSNSQGDVDLDAEVSRRGVKDLISPKTSTQRQPPFGLQGGSTSVSISRRTLPDGSIEERRVVRDNDGEHITTNRIPPPGEQGGFSGAYGNEGLFPREDGDGSDGLLSWISRFFGR